MGYPKGIPPLPPLGGGGGNLHANLMLARFMLWALLYNSVFIYSIFMPIVLFIISQSFFV